MIIRNPYLILCFIICSYTLFSSSDKDYIRSSQFGTIKMHAPFDNIQKQFLKHNFDNIDKDIDIKTFILILENSNLYSFIDTTTFSKNKTIKILPSFRIKDIEINHNTHLEDQEILQIIAIKSGFYVSKSTLAKEMNNINVYLKNNGYLENELDYSLEGSTGESNLIINIKNNKTYKIRSFKIKNCQRINSFLLKLSTGLFRYKLTNQIYSPKQISEDLLEIRKHYQNRMFYDMKINAEINIDSTLSVADIYYVIDEGKEYDIQFRGNDSFFDYELKSALKSLQRAGIVAAVKASKDIEQEYSTQGFKDISCSYQLEEDKEKIQIYFDINEGPEYIIDSVSFLGIKKIKKQLVMDNTLSIPDFFDDAYDKKRINSDLKAIKFCYYNNGFLDANIDYKTYFNENHVHIVFNIQENKQHLVNSVTFMDKGKIPDSLKKHLSLQKDSIFTKIKINKDRQAILNYLHKKGHINAKVSYKQEKLYNYHNIKWLIDPKNSYKIDKVFIVGNFQTDSNFVKSKMEIDENSYYSLEKLIKSRSNLLRTSIYNSVNIRDFSDIKVSSPMIFNISEKKPYSLELSLGYDNLHRINTSLRFSNINFWGYAKYLDTYLYFSDPVHNAEINFKDKHTNFHNFQYTITAFYTYEDYLNRRFFLKEYGSQFFGSMQFGLLIPGFTARFINKRVNYIYNSANDNTYRAATILSPSLTIDTRNDLIVPNKGGYYSLQANYSFGHKIKNDTYSSYILDLRYLYPLITKSLVIAVRNKTALIPFKTTIHEDNLFFIGGLTSVRGYSENKLYYSSKDNKAIGSLGYSLQSIELRYLIWENLELDLFVDNAYTYKLSNKYNLLNSWKSSCGMGLRYITKIGPLGILYGHKLNKIPKESNGKFYFSIGYTF